MEASHDPQAARIIDLENKLVSCELRAAAAERNYADSERDREKAWAEVSTLSSRLDSTAKLVTHQAVQIHELQGRLDALQTNLREAYELLNDAVAEHDYHVDVSAACVWLAANESVVESLAQNSKTDA